VLKHTIVFILLSLFIFACNPESKVVEPAWGLGSKADDGQCSSNEDLCWNFEDSAVMRRILVLDRLLYSEGEFSLEAFEQMMLDIDQLSHKMTTEELRRLDEIRFEIENPQTIMTAEEAYYQVQETLTRIKAVYFGAHLVSAGSRAEQIAAGEEDQPVPGKADGLFGEDGIFSTEGYTDDLKDTLEILRKSSLLGEVYAVLLQATGVLEVDYPILEPETMPLLPDGSRELPEGRSREERVKRIINNHSLLAGAAGVVYGLASLIPFAGVILSVAVDVATLYPIQSSMVFRIAGVYGIDIRQGRNMLTANMLVFWDELDSITAELLPVATYSDILGKAINIRTGLGTAYVLSTALASHYSGKIFSYLIKKSKTLASLAASKKAAAAIGSQVIGWATMGFTVLASGASNWVVTDYRGERAAGYLRRWLVDLMVNGTPYLGSRQARDCAISVIGKMMWIDSIIDENEKNIFVALLAKPYYLGDQEWTYLDSNERIEHSRRLKDLEHSAEDFDDFKKCLSDHIRKEAKRFKLDFLSLLYGMLAIDGFYAIAEIEYYNQITDHIDGKGLFDGPQIPETLLIYMEQAIDVIANPQILANNYDVYVDGLDEIGTRDIIGYLSQPDENALSDFECGFYGTCD
jgi:uncharacterized protein (DUF697 family)